ncbi:MAG: hypothetical protein H6553_01755 [Chitinophagales bacterium]|nr:hypothetical protein [Chitinophagales bacterium]
MNLELNKSKYLLIVAVILIFSACKRKTVTVKNNNGVVVQSYEVLRKQQNIKDGKFTSFYDDGTKMEESNYVNGKQDGISNLYYQDGKLMIERHFKMDVYDGDYKEYYENGFIKQEGKYKDNMMDGVWKNYYASSEGLVSALTTMKDGKINGDAKEFATNGKLYVEGNKVEIFGGIDVYNGIVKVYDTISGKQIYNLEYEDGKQVKKDSIF